LADFGGKPIKARTERTLEGQFQQQISNDYGSKREKDK
jgi:hypothetical protein